MSDTEKQPESVLARVADDLRELSSDLWECPTCLFAYHSRHRSGPADTCPCCEEARLTARISALETALREVRAGIVASAPDTVWVGPAETAVDRIDSLLTPEAKPAEDCPLASSERFTSDGRCKRHEEDACPSCLTYTVGDLRAQLAAANARAEKAEAEHQDLLVRSTCNQARLEMNRHQGDFLQARLEEVTRGRDEAVRREVGNFEEVKTHRAELMLLHARLALAKELLRNCDLSLSDPEWDAERCAFLAEPAPATLTRTDVEDALKRGVKDAAELNARIAPVFTLPDRPLVLKAEAAPAAEVKEPREELGGAMHVWPAAQPKPLSKTQARTLALQQPQPPSTGLYRHHKGGLYRVTGTARDSTNGPGEGRTLVLYSLVRRDPIDGISLLGSEHAREVGQFLETVDGKPRFSREGT